MAQNFIAIGFYSDCYSRIFNPSNDPLWAPAFYYSIFTLMTSQLTIVRHAKASKKSSSNIDRYRCLVKTWIEQVKQLVYQFELQNLKPDLIITSGAPRAYQTAVIIAEHLILQSNQIIVESELYRCTISQWIKKLQEHSRYNHILIVGHNPELLDLCNYLFSNPPRKLGKWSYITWFINTHKKRRWKASFIRKNSSGQ